MTTPRDLGYAFALSLPPAEDERVRAWARATSGATWDISGSHVTLARLTGSVPPEKLVPVIREAWSGVLPSEVTFRKPVREPYWDKPGLEIVMLAGETEADVAGVFDIRERLIESLLPQGLALFESGPFVPHVTLTTGLPPEEALRLEAAASALELRFVVHEVAFWCGGETTDPDMPADPAWYVVERMLL